MKKIMFFFVSFIFCFLHAENSNFVLRLYYPYGGDIRYTEEFKFYDDGLVKQMIHYDLRDEVDYYQWDNIKKDLKILRKFYIDRTEDNITITKEENGTKKVISSFIKTGKNSWNYYYKKEKNDFFTVEIDAPSIKISPNYVSIGGEISHLVDNKLIKIAQSKRNGIEEYTLEYDGKKEYKLKTNDPDGEDCSTVIFVSDYIEFEKEAAVLNFYIQNFPPHVFFSIPAIPKDKSTNNSVTIKKSSHEDFGYDYYTLGKQKYLCLKSENLALLYTEDDSLPKISELPVNCEIIPITNLYASSTLKEGNIEYTVDNISSLTLHKPWVEGVKGNGVDEYFQFNKSDASGFYILNGFVSFSRPDLFEKNNRVEKVSISGLSSKKTVDVVLIDTAKPQYIDLSEFKDDEIIRITIKSVYNGSKYNDTCVSGIMLVKS